MRYNVLAADTPREMGELVQGYLDAGWKLYGPLRVAVGMIDSPYIQAVIKEKSHGEETESLCEGASETSTKGEEGKDVPNVQEADE